MKSPDIVIDRMAARASSAFKLALWRRKIRSGEPVSFDLPSNQTIRLWPEGQITELLFTRNFESAELNMCSRVWRPGMTVVDVGANIGLYTIAASLAVGPTGRVYGFEPSSESRFRLLRNLELNNCQNVTVIDAAVTAGDIPSATLVRDRGFRDGDRYLRPSNPAALAVSEGGGDIEKVSTCTLDEWSDRISDLDVGFMKIDVEGGEFAVFSGAHDFLRRENNLVIMFECNAYTCERCGHTQAEVFAQLMEAGFGLFTRAEEDCEWSSDPSALRTAGNVWAAKNASLLPT